MSDQIDVTEPLQVNGPEHDTELEITQGMEYEISGDVQVIEITQPHDVQLFTVGETLSSPFHDDRVDTTVISGFASVRGFTRVELSWIELTVPARHETTLVYRSTTPSIHDAVCVGDSQTQTFTDTIEPASEFYYWLRPTTYQANFGLPSEPVHVMPSADAPAILQFLGLDGLTQALADLEALIEQRARENQENLEELNADALYDTVTLINEQIAIINGNMVLLQNTLGLSTETSLAQMRDQITILVDADNARIQTINELTARVESEVETRLAQITSLNEANVTQDSASATQRDELIALINNEAGSRQAAITTERTASVSREQAIANSLETLRTQFTTDLSTANAAIDTERNARTSADGALAQQISNISAGFNTAQASLNARIDTEQQARADGDSAVALELTNLETRFNGNLATFQASVEQSLETYSDESTAYAEEVVELRAELDTGFVNALAEANSYTNARVGVCYINGNLADYSTKAVCEAAGGTWRLEPFAETSRNVSISYTRPDGSIATGNAGYLFQLVVNEVGNVEQRAHFGFDENGYITGLLVKGESGNFESRKIQLVASEVEILDEESGDPFIKFNTQDRIGEVRGRLILSDGTIINNAADIEGGNGVAGSGFYTIVTANGTFPSDATATTAFNNNFGRAPVVFDHLTYTNSTKTTATTKRFNGTGWVAPLLVVNGDALVRGTVTTDHLAANAVTADKINVTDLFAQDIEATGSISGAKVFVEHAASGNKIALDPSTPSILRISNASEDLLKFDAQNRLEISAGLADHTINRSSMFSPAIWELISQSGGGGEDTGPLTGGTFTAENVSGNSVMTQTLVMDPVNTNTTTLSFRFSSSYLTNNPGVPVWNIKIEKETRPKGGYWSAKSTVHDQEYRGFVSQEEGNTGIADILVNYTEDLSITAQGDEGSIRFTITAEYVSGSYDPVRVAIKSIVATQKTAGGGTASGASTWDELSGKPATATRWPQWSEVSDKPNVALKPNNHTANDSEYSMVWENNGGILYTSTEHLKYNPNKRRITTGSVLLNGDNAGTIGGSNWNAGWLRIGTDSAGIAMDPNEFYFADTGNIGTLSGQLVLNPATTVRINGDYLYGGGANAVFRWNDEWLRLNPDSDFESGIYCGSRKLRTDGEFQVGNDGAAFRVTTSSIVASVAINSDHSLNIRKGKSIAWMHDDYNGIVEAKLDTSKHLWFRMGGNSDVIAIAISHYDDKRILLNRSGIIEAINFKATSDKRKKRNFTGISDALGKLEVLTGYTYDMITTGDRDAGIIAQDLQKVLPEAVSENHDGFLTISPTGVIALLVNAVNELREKVCQ